MSGVSAIAAAADVLAAVTASAGAVKSKSVSYRAIAMVLPVLDVYKRQLQPSPEKSRVFCRHRCALPTLRYQGAGKAVSAPDKRS